MYKKIYLAGLLIIFFISCNPSAVYAFLDTRQHWASSQIDHLQNRELINGYPDDTFAPEKYISRGELVTLIINVLNKSAEAKQLLKGQAYFTDTVNHWARGYIELARELDIAHGDGKAHFYPDNPVSREEAVTMLVSSLQVGLDELPPAKFEDSSAISFWAQKSVNYAVDQALLHGYPDNTFRPQQNLTRAEVAVLLEEYLALQGQKFHFYGILEKIDLPLRRAKVIIGDQEHVFELSANVVGYDEDQGQPLTQLDLPAKGYFSLNPEGKIAYIYLSKQYTQGELELNISSLPKHYNIPLTDDNIVKLTDEQDEAEAKVQSSLAEHPEKSLQITAEAMQAPQFFAKTGATGRGQLVAVIDSGIDPGHPDLQSTSEGYRKIVDFIDLSDEGLVNLTEVQAKNGELLIGDKAIDVSNIRNLSNVYKYGYLDLSILPTEVGIGNKRLLIVAAADKNPGIFDTVYLDTDLDGEVNDQIALEEYNRTGGVAIIEGDGNKAFNLLLAKLPPEGEYAHFGFDLLGHGTEVAGIVAAQGKIQGIAPDAQLLVVKVMDRSGTTSLKKIESALSLAAERGAKVAVVSMGQYKVSKAEKESLEKLLANIKKVSGMLICMAAGNNGPGLGTVAGTATLENIISVGAYTTPSMWNNDYGWQVEEPTLWYFSSSGPAADASAAPLLLAPGNAISTYPLWSGQSYRLDEGTSIAAPHLAGAAALLLDAGIHKLYIDDAWAIGRALIGGAESLPNFQVVEQGLGTVNLLRAWDELQKQQGKSISLDGIQYSPGLGPTRGLYTRGLAPGELSLKIINNEDQNEQLSIGGLASWVKPGQYMVQVPAHSQRAIDIQYDELKEPGLYSTLLVADKHNTPEWDLAMLQTIVLPYDLSQIGDNGFMENAELAAGQFKRYFFQVPEGASSLNFKLSVGDKGRARLHVVSPQGSQEVSQYAGVGDTQVTASVNMHYSQPVPGVWEVVVYSSATLSDYDLAKSQLALEVKYGAKNNNNNIGKPSDGRYIITTIPPLFKPGKEACFTLHFWNAGSKQPAQGTVSINNRLYEIRNGMIKLKTVPLQEKIRLNIAW
ncbi:MAG: S8 family serine peptidase [Syntrophomonadaceae bacterium]|jgi:tripeptidyl-peptidase-2